MVLIFRLTSSSGMTGLRSQAGHYTGQSNSISKNTSPSVPVYRSGVGRFGGVQAFVTSHQTIDDEKGTYGPRSLTTSMYASNDQLGSNMNTAANTTTVPQLFNNQPTSAPNNRKNDKADDLDNDSVSELGMQNSGQSGGGVH